MVGEVLSKVLRCSVLYHSVAIGCALQAHSSKVQLIAPNPDVLQRPLAAGYYCMSTVVLQWPTCSTTPQRLRPMCSYKEAKKLRFLAPSGVL